MAIIIWSGKHTTQKHLRHEPWSFDIHDWRMIKEGVVYVDHHKRAEVGVLISAKDQIRFMPHMTIKQIMEYNNHGKEIKFEHYHVGYRSKDEAITYCYDCKGIGKFDWIQQAAVARRLKWGDAPKHFVRDETCYYVHPEFDNYLFSKVQLQPGDVYCSLCHGFGIMLDARFNIFKGMVGIKKRLIKVNH